MTVAEMIATHCVIVNGGSGVLISAMSQEYSYILTAAHVLEANDLDNEIKNHRGAPIRIIGVNRHPDEKYDCAVIQVEYIPDIAQFSWPAASLENRANLMLAGFPTTERKSETPLKYYDGHMTSVVDGLIVFTINGIPDRATIEGMSGGGIYYVHAGHPYLVGIECRMDGEHEAQQYGRVQSQSLFRFEEIIQAKKLAYMVPSFLECFSCFREHIFHFNVIEPSNVEMLQTALLDVADKLVARGMPAPYKLMDKYKGDLLISNTNHNELKDKDLWIAYFEFLIICVLIDGVDNASDAYIQGLERKRRILYSSNDRNWVGRLEEILKAARKMLDEKGTVIIATPEGGADVTPPKINVDRIISNISAVPNNGAFIQIDNPESAIYKSFVLTHLNGLRKSCVVHKEEEFKAAPGTEQLKLFRGFFNEIIK